MAAQPRVADRLRFDGSELDVGAGELRKHGVRLRLRGPAPGYLRSCWIVPARLSPARSFRVKSGLLIRSLILTTAWITQLRGFAECWAIRRRRRAAEGVRGTACDPSSASRKPS
jgi:hypothetical protein